MNNVLRVIYPAEKSGERSLLTRLFHYFSLISQYREMYSRNDPSNNGEKATESGTPTGKKGCHSP